jgi:hypothetical protein
MNIKDCVDFINFWIRKERGSFLTIDESVAVIDRGQIAYYNDLIPKYAVSQIIKDTLMPFKEKYDFTTAAADPQLVTIPELFQSSVRTASAASVGTTINVTSTLGLTIGQVVIVTGGAGLFQPGTIITSIINATSFTVNIEPITAIATGNSITTFIYKEYLDLLDLTIQYPGGVSGTAYYSVKMTNEDELADKLNSQINPPSINLPVGIMFQRRSIQLYPANTIYTGFVHYMRRPVKPVYGYSVIGGRSIVYNPSQSVQLEWKDTDVNFILLKALSSIGINLSDQEASQFAEMKSQENYQGVNHL